MRVMRPIQTSVVMCHRSIIDAEGKMTAEVPFYDRNCVLYPPDQKPCLHDGGRKSKHKPVLYRSVYNTR